MGVSKSALVGAYRGHRLLKPTEVATAWVQIMLAGDVWTVKTNPKVPISDRLSPAVFTDDVVGAGVCEPLPLPQPIKAAQNDAIKSVNRFFFNFPEIVQRFRVNEITHQKVTSLYNSSDLERCIDSMRHAAAIPTAPIKIVKDSGWGLSLHDTTSLLLSRRMVRTTRFF